MNEATKIIASVYTRCSVHFHLGNKRVFSPHPGLLYYNEIFMNLISKKHTYSLHGTKVDIIYIHSSSIFVSMCP